MTGEEAIILMIGRNEPQPVIEEAGLTPYCPNCGSAVWMTNEDGEPNNYCGKCGQRLDWEHPENPDAEADKEDVE